MKDDNAPLSCFGIKPNGQITMMGTRPTVSTLLFIFLSFTCLSYLLVAAVVDDDG